jgi:hypothetical protein
VRGIDEISGGARSTGFFLAAQGHDHSSTNSGRISLLPAIVAAAFTPPYRCLSVDVYHDSAFCKGLKNRATKDLKRSAALQYQSILAATISSYIQNIQFH